MYHSALISVYDKCCITDVVKHLANQNIKIISTGGTAALLRKKGYHVIEVSSITNFSEIMSGRVKTLHPKIFGGILARRNIHSDLKELNNIGAIPIDIVIVNLYPFKEMSKKNLDEQQLLEFIDIGGVSLIRAAAKNYKDVIVITDKEDYPLILKCVNQKKQFPPEIRKKLAIKAFKTTALYDKTIYQILQNYSL